MFRLLVRWSGLQYLLWLHSPILHGQYPLQLSQVKTESVSAWALSLPFVVYVVFPLFVSPLLTFVDGCLDDLPPARAISCCAAVASQVEGLMFAAFMLRLKTSFKDLTIPHATDPTQPA